MPQDNPYYVPSWGSKQINGYGDSSTYLDQDRQQNAGQQSGQDYGQMAQGAMAGLSAGAANSEPVGDFEVDQYAGFKGSGEGLMKGGVIGAIIGGGVAQYGQFSKINKNLKKLDTSVQGVTYDAYGRPVYQGGNFVNAQQNVAALNDGVKKLNRTHLDPATNIISSFSGTRRRMKRKRGELQQGIKQAQQDYNQSELTYQNQMNARQEYYQGLNNNRLYNLMRAQY